MLKNRWPLWIGGIFALVMVMLLVAAPGMTYGVSPTPTPTSLLDSLPFIVGPTPTDTPTLGPLGPTPTRPRTGLASPTPAATERIAAPLMTLTAFSGMVKGTLDARPTWTPGPTAITLDGKPQFVKFYADWCGPCRLMKPDVEKMKVKYAGKVTFWDFNTDAVTTRALSVEYDVQFIPLVVLLDPSGKLVRRLEGLQTEQELETAIQELLKASQ